MSTKVLLVFLITVVVIKAQGNDICPCDEKDNAEDKRLLKTLLEKLSKDIDNDDEQLYSVYPGFLTDFNCNCENQRRKRKTPVEQPKGQEDQSQDQVENVDPMPEEMKKRSVNEPDRRCPVGHVRFAFTCVPVSSLNDY